MFKELQPLCSEDVPEVEVKLKDLKTQCLESQELGNKRQEKVSDIQDKVAIFIDVIRPSKEKLIKVEKTLNDLNPLSGDKDKAVKTHEDLEKLGKQVEDLENRTAKLNTIADSLQNHHPESDSKQLRNDADEIKHRVEKLKKLRGLKMSEVQNLLSDWAILENNINKAVAIIKKMNLDSEASKPKTLDVGELKCIMENIQAVEKELNEHSPLFEDIHKHGKKLREKGVVLLEDNLSGINLQFKTIQSRIPDQLVELQKISDKLNNFDEKLVIVEEDIKSLENSFEEQAPIGADEETLSNQIQSIEELISELEKLQLSLSELNYIRSDLNSNYPDTDKTKVNEPFNKLNDRMNNISQRVYERRAKLEGSLLQSGQFGDAIKSLLGWLDETKALLDNQKPINAADENVLKAQIQEQKLLSRMFTDRESSLKHLQKTAEGLLASTEDLDKKQEVEEDLMKVDSIWCLISNRVNKRKDDLEHTLVNAEKFNKSFNELDKILAELDEKISSEKNIPFGDGKKVEEQLEEMVTIGDRLKDLKDHLENVGTDEADLLPMCTPDDSQIIKDKRKKLANKHDFVREKFQKKLNDLEKAGKLIEEFAASEKALDEKIEDAKEKLKSKNPDSVEEVKIKNLQKEIVKCKPILDSLKDQAKELKKLISPNDYPQIKKRVEVEEDKLKNLKLTVDQCAHEMFMANEKIDDFNSKVDDLSKWTNEKLKEYRLMEPVAVEPEKVKAQLAKQQIFATDISGKEPLFREIYNISDAIVGACNSEEAAPVKEKVDNLKYNKLQLDKFITERHSHLVEALLLAQQFADIFKEVGSRLNNTEKLLKILEEDKGKGVELQKEKLNTVEENVKQLQPLMSTLHITGGDLMKISGPGQSSDNIKKKLKECDEQWDSLKLSSEDKGIKIVAAAEQVEAIWNELDDLIEKSQALKEVFKNQEPIPVKEDEIVEEILKLEKQEAELELLNKPIDHANKNINGVIQEDSNSPSANALKERQKKMNNLWKYNTTAAIQRRCFLEKSRDAAQKFWLVIEKLKETLVDVQVKMDDEGEPTIDTKLMEELMRDHEDLHTELDSNEDMINSLMEATPVLVANASPENKSDVHKYLSDITDQWDNLEAQWNKKKSDMEEVKSILDDYVKNKDFVNEWLSLAENKMENKKSLPNGISEVREHLRDQRDLQRDLTKHQGEIALLSQKAEALANKVNDDDAEKVQEELSEIQKRWDDLLEKCYKLQSDLEDTLINQGHFGIAIEELLVWVTQTKTELKNFEPITYDKKFIDIETSKLKTISNDVECHKPNVENCKISAQKVIDNGKSTPDLNKNLAELNCGWEEIQELLLSRSNDLNEALDNANVFEEKVQDLTSWIVQSKTSLKTKAPYGGKLSVINKQLDEHQEFILELEIHEEIYFNVIETYEVIIKSSDPSSAREYKKIIGEMQSDWKEIKTLCQATKEKLENAQEDARIFDTFYNDILNWIVEVKNSPKLLSPVSTIIETIEIQMAEFEEVYTIMGNKREKFIILRKAADKIKQNCDSEEALAFEEDILELTKQWKNVSTILKDHKKVLDENYNQSKIFFEGHEQLITFLDEIEAKINSDPTIGKDASSVKAQLKKHKECQNDLGKKQTKLNAIVKAGSILTAKSNADDVQVIEEKIEILRSRWDIVCSLSVDRQHRLEEALLFHGMFHDAVQTLLDWLNTVEPGLISETAVMGDPDTVKLLIDNHTAFQKALDKKHRSYDSVIKTGEAMIAEGKVDNVEELKDELEQLKDKWDAVEQMTLTKTERLSSAYALSKEFKIGCSERLQNLSDLEKQLLAQGPIVEEIQGIKEQIEEFHSFEELLEKEEMQVNGCLKKGEVILRFCHPSALQTIRHQVAVVKKRWSDVSSWAKQRKGRLDEGLKVLIEEEIITNELIDWITEKESILEEREKLPLQDDFEIVSRLLEEHNEFKNLAELKQPDYNKIIKAAKRKPITDLQRRSMTPMRSKSVDLNQMQRDFASPKVEYLSKKWQHFWLLLLNRLTRIQDLLDSIRIRKAAAEFSWEDWRNRYNEWLHSSKSRVLDMWRKNDSNKDNKLTREQFINGVIDQCFPAERWEIDLVFTCHQRRNLIFYQDFMDALKGRARKPDKPVTESEQIHDIIELEVSKCCCPHPYSVLKVAEGKYRFGDNQKLRLIRFLRSTVMVRVGGGWETLSEFLEKNDPCKGIILKNIKVLLFAIQL